jgi:flagellar biosynthesis/type III secretory pathway protein FliH
MHAAQIGTFSFETSMVGEAVSTDGLSEGEAEGLAEGLSEGEAEGMSEGEAEGLTEGLSEGGAEQYYIYACLGTLLN